MIGVLVLAILGAQKQQRLIQAEEHVATVRLVLVDVIITKDGKFVTDLDKDEFELFEDDKKIAINSLELISYGARESRLQKEESEATSQPAPKKQLVVVFDGVSSW
jgi:hypothetical protein